MNCSETDKFFKLMKSLPNVFAFGLAIALFWHHVASAKTIDPAFIRYSNRGFAATISSSDAMQFKNGNGDIDYFDTRFIVPVWGTKWSDEIFTGATFQYELSSLNSKQTLGLATTILSDVKLQLSTLRKPQGDQGWMGLVTLNPSIASDFNTMGQDSFQMSTLLVAGYQFSPQFTLAAASFNSYSFGEMEGMPGIGLLWKPNEEWTFQLMPPVIAIGWSPDDQWTLSLSAYRSGGAWDVTQLGTNQDIETIRLANWRVGLAAEYFPSKNITFTTQIGLNMGGEFRLQNQQNQTLFRRSLDPSLFMMIGLSYQF
jgi:Domain of unknown function (DUF6268)